MHLHSLKLVPSQLWPPDFTVLPTGNSCLGRKIFHGSDYDYYCPLDCKGMQSSSYSPAIYLDVWVCVFSNRGDPFGRPHIFLSLFLLWTFLTGQVHVHLYSVQMLFDMTYWINLLDPLTLLPKPHTILSLQFTFPHKTFFLCLFLLKTYSSAPFAQDVLAQPLTHYHLPWLAQSHVIPYTSTPAFTLSRFPHNTGTIDDW
jgi:hypothetical protein